MAEYKKTPSRNIFFSFVAESQQPKGFKANCETLKQSRNHLTDGWARHDATHINAFELSHCM